MRRRLLWTLTLTAALTVGGAFAAHAAGWAQDANGWWYQYEDGSCAKNGMRSVDGQEHYFDENGYMKTGWIYTQWQWYYADQDGNLCKGWQKLDGSWYYFQEDGVLKTGWLTEGRNLYYLGEDGKMRHGLFEAEGYQYWADYETGIIKRNKSEGTVKYNSDGTMSFYSESTKSWDYMPDKETIGDAMKQNLRENNLNDASLNLERFEIEARETLKSYLSAEAIERFLDEFEEEYEDARSNDPIYEEYEYEEEE